MTDARAPSMRPSNEVRGPQLDIARRQGEAYDLAMLAMAEENGIRRTRTGDLLVAFTTEQAEGMYALHDGRLIWVEPAEGANTHLEVMVADAGDGRFVPQLDVTVAVQADGRELFRAELPFLWHPFLYHYVKNARVPDEGPYDVVVEIQAPSFMRHDPVNGRRYPEPVETVFTEVRFNTGVKPGPNTAPRGAIAPTAG